MRANITPSGKLRTFGPNELIVSKTDRKGVLTYVNDVFLRVSAYSHADVVGQPHSIVRHPEMPRGVFKLLWDSISSGREIFAYVNNLAADGAHYWVLAHVTPTFDASGAITGYHSNRRMPSLAEINAVSRIYADMRRTEAPISNNRAAAEASVSALTKELQAKDTSYHEFVWTLMQSRQGAAA